MADKRKIGIFGGAFNPIHNGHIKTASDFAQKLSLDRVIFVPTSVAPHKSSDSFASKEDRLAMLNTAIKGYKNFAVSDIEFKRKGKSYTYDTLVELKKIYPDDDFFLLIGADQLLSFNSWYRYKDILKMVTLCAAGRHNENEKELMAKYAENLKGLQKSKFVILDTPVLTVSSSDIRSGIKNGEDISEFLPRGVYEYICRKGIYRYDFI